ncbi:MAG: HAD hydrolase-like protein, partial [Candidatus Methanomethylicia archaeon]
IACNEDHVLPVDEWTIPGAGAIVASLIKSTGFKPVFVAGKPNTYLADIVMSSFNVPRDSILVVGDRCDMDVVFARNANIDSLLVLTGVSTVEDARLYKPTYVVEDLLDFIKCYGGLRV